MDIITTESISSTNYEIEAKIIYEMYSTLGILKNQVIYGLSNFKEGNTIITITDNKCVIEYDDGTKSVYENQLN